ncbi:MAG: CoA-binding protein [Melioribacteraceae bacterium]|nr:CoA-binding protein [Melioribacteraceae bacterium]MCF8263015.1 CoA-binding protein [Melioribacteraceae bacterium]MCF8430460.1 CoA-binding protein [Melioribacteraceae bacterium]
MDYNQKVKEFLNLKNIAIAGVSRNPKTEVGNAIYKKFKESGYNVFPINPNADVIEGDKCYPNLSVISEKVEGVFVATRPEISLTIANQCKELGISKMWLHSTLGNGSFYQGTVDFCKENGISLIEKGCPMLHLNPVDGGHKVIRFFLKLFRKI